MNKMNFIKRITLSLVLLVVVILGITYMNYKQIAVEHSHHDQFMSNLNRVIETNSTFNMAELTAFDWDKMYMFGPYTSRQEMEKTIGAKWTTASFIGYYTWEQTVFGQNPLNADEVHSLVFTNNGKVVFDLVLFRNEADFTTINKVTNVADATFHIGSTKLIEQK